MSAETNFNTVTAMLEQTYFLKEIPEMANADEVKESHKADGYILQPYVTEEKEYTSGGLLTSFGWRLEIVFLNKTSLDRAKKFDTFNSIKQGLQQLTGFIGFLEGTSFNRLANFSFISIGTINFKMGIEGNC